MYIWKKKSFKFLKFGKKSISGRNRRGQIVLGRRGAGVKKCYRLVDFFRFPLNLWAKLLRIEFDPNRSALIGLIIYTNGILSYILYTNFWKIGYFSQINLKNSVNQIKNLALNTIIHNIELKPFLGGQFCRSSGIFAKIEKKVKNKVIIKMPSGYSYIIDEKSFVSLGQVANNMLQLKKKHKAGTNRLLGFRPVVRGVAKNPIDHPHGGGEGKSKGNRFPVNFKGLLTKGFKTVKKKSKFTIF